MPAYDFRCTRCQHKFEHRQGMNDPNPPCPQEISEEGQACGGETEKLITGGNFHLKGAGWYKTDYAGK